MMHIRRIRLVLPARFANIAPGAAREIAERMINAAHGRERTLGQPVRLTDRGQTAAQLGLEAGQMARRGRKDGGRR